MVWGTKTWWLAIPFFSWNVTGDFTVLQERAVQLQRASVAEGTRRNLTTVCTLFRRFTQKYQLVFYLLTLEVLHLFIAWLSWRMKSPNTVQNYVSGLKSIWQLAGWNTSTFQHDLLKRTLTGCRCLMCHEVQQATPVMPDFLKKVAQLVDWTDCVQVAIFASLLLGFYLFLRASNLAPQSKNAVGSALTKSHLALGKHVALLTITWSKTIQFRNKNLQLPLMATADTDICPVWWLKYSGMANGQQEEPLCSVSGVWLTQPLLTHWLKSWGEKVNPRGRYMLHSLRRGGASWAYVSELASTQIQVLGDWASEAYKTYLDHNLDDRVQAMTLMVQHL